MSLCEHLRKLEESLLSSAVRKDHDYVATLLADDFREFGSSGRSFTKTAILAELQAELALSDITLNDFVCSFLAEGVAFLTYRTVRRMPTDILLMTLRSSIWILRDARWQMIFHQGTKVP